MDVEIRTDELEQFVKDIIRHHAPDRWTWNLEQHVRDAIGNTTYEDILKRLHVLEEMCLEHRADWAEQRLRALEDAVKELKGGKGSEANRRGYATDKFSGGYVPSDLNASIKADLQQAGVYGGQVRPQGFDHGGDSSDQDPVL